MVKTRLMSAPIVLAQTKPAADIVKPQSSLRAVAAAPSRLSPTSRKRTADQLRSQAAAFRPKGAQHRSDSWNIQTKPPLGPRDTNVAELNNTKPAKAARTTTSKRWAERVDDSEDDELPPLPWR